MTNIIQLPIKGVSSHDSEDVEALAHFLTWAREEALRLGLHETLSHVDQAIAGINMIDRDHS